MDLNLHIHPQATALLHSLADIEETVIGDEIPKSSRDYRITATALYNGRERGICLSVTRKPIDEKALGIFFTECRNSDQLFVQVDMVPVSINPPTIDDFSEESYANRKHFEEWNIKGARNTIIARILSYLNGD